MTEWGVVTVIIALVGLVATVAGPDERLINHETRISKLEADHHTEG